MANPEATYSIGAVVKATGVGEATLRQWESRFGFPDPEREPSGHRRYSEEDVERIRTVVRHREDGLPLRLAIERAESAGEPSTSSIFARLRRTRPELAPQALKSRHMAKLSRAVEEETAARAEEGLLIGAFQREDAYRRSESRWRDLVGGGMTSFVLADFGKVRTPAAAPSEVPIGGAPPMAAEWVLVCLARGHSACLVGRERPGQDRDDNDRIFDGFLSLEPEVVREAAQEAVRIAAPQAPAVASSAQHLLDAAVDADPVAQLRLSGLITSRFIAALG
jgi:MerR family transcriptional regulator, light-induced transcriptional regulator